MSWLAFALVTALLLYGAWRVWRDWISPSRDLEETVAAIGAGQPPRTYLTSGHERMRRIGLGLEEIALRQNDLQVRLQQSEFGMRSIVGALADGLAVVDRERRIRLTNTALEKMFADRLTSGQTLLEIARDAAVEQSLGEALASGAPGRCAMTRAQGEQHLEVVITPIHNSAAGITGAVVLFRDVTSHHRTEAMRRDFVANVSHELRTPLSILRGYLETLLENPKQPAAELLRIFEVMERHSQRLNLVVDDVLSLARLEGAGATLSLTTVRPAQFLRGIMRDWERKFAAKNLRVELDASEKLPPLPVDEARLQEVIYNLLENAVKYSDAGGRLIVRANEADGQICFGVTDSGVGISPRDLPRIFERFYRADKSRQRDLGGSGLGLAIVKHIAQLHGGSVVAESELGCGTTVRVYFPLAQPGHATVAESEKWAVTAVG